MKMNKIMVLQTEKKKKQNPLSVFWDAETGSGFSHPSVSSSCP